jgi:hypothetical protein
MWSGDVGSPFLTSALDGGERSVSPLCRCTSGERTPGTHWIGGWVDPTAALEVTENRKILHCRFLRKLFRPRREEVTGRRIELHNWDLHDLQVSRIINRMNKRRSVRLAGRVAPMGEKKNAHIFLLTARRRRKIRAWNTKP